MSKFHTPVLQDKVLEYLKHIKKGTIVDCTAGFGGHSEALLKLDQNTKLICNDQDSEALKFCQKRLEKYDNRITYHKGNFENILDKFQDESITAILADIGVSSYQLDNLNRGFGFDSPKLDMRMDTNNPITAYEIINGYDIVSLQKILKNFGEIKEYKKIADLIVASRPINDAKQLSSLIKKNSYNKRGFHPATLVFQAIRIEVNRELEVLERLLESIKNSNIKKCTVVIISFHSLEDRVVKHMFNKWSKNCICPDYEPRCICGNNHNIGKKITKKPITPTTKEQQTNPRARSAKLRVFEILR
ncbi:MAG: 16S rRNA (cytosine(1402)-N(4))-methyltransferase [Epsilonproteobacteria bacterium]|nr:MAG: 16S rRNA (cytosine(1402)-N(4))-methyltransferase [Campylobacterota bacterium]